MISYKRISKNSRILPDLVTINFIHERAIEQHSKPSDESIKEKYRQFMKDAIDWNAFPSLLKDLYHNDNEEVGRPNIPITTMVKILFLQSLYNLYDQQVEKEIHDRISFMNFLDYPDILPDSKTIWFIP